MPAMIFRNQARNLAFGSQTTAIDKLKGKIGGKSGSLPYNSARVGLPAQTAARWASRRRTCETGPEADRRRGWRGIHHGTVEAASGLAGYIWLLTRANEQLKPEERTFIAHLSTAALDLAQAVTLTAMFITLVREAYRGCLRRLDGGRGDQRIAKLCGRIETRRGSDSGSPDGNLEHKPVEGQIDRLMVLKRQMYGRAKYDLLLRSRVLAAV
jgi:transposase